MTAILYRLVGYDPASQRVVAEYEIAVSRLDYARRGEQTRDIAGAVGARVGAEALNFYMEGFAVPAGLDPADQSE